MLPSFRLLSPLTRPPSEITNTPRGAPDMCYAHGDDPRTDRSRDRTTAAAPAQSVTTLADAPLCVHGMDSARTHLSRQDRPSRCRAGQQQGRRWSRRQAPRRPQGMDTDGRRDDHRDGRSARQKGAQSRTEDAQPQPVRIAENVTVYLHPDDATPAARRGHSPAADRRETTIHMYVMSIEGYERISTGLWQ